MFLGNELRRSDAHVNSKTDELLPSTLFHCYQSFHRSEKFRTLIHFDIGVLTTGELRRYSKNRIRNTSKHLS